MNSTQLEKNSEEQPKGSLRYSIALLREEIVDCSYNHVGLQNKVLELRDSIAPVLKECNRHKSEDPQVLEEDKGLSRPEPECCPLTREVKDSITLVHSLRIEIVDLIDYIEKVRKSLDI